MLSFKLPGLKDKDGFVLLDDMRGNFSRSGLETSISEMLEPEPGAVVRCILLGIAHPPLDVVESQEFSFFWLRTLKHKHKQKKNSKNFIEVLL